MKKIKIDIKFFKTKYGVGKTILFGIFHKFGFNNRITNFKLKKTNIKHINKNLKLRILEKTLLNKGKESITFLKKIKSYRGLRHKLRLPCRGQRTKTNKKTIKKKTNLMR